jgi:hypothetical protein
MKRICSVLAVVALMAVMLVVSAMPAFAAASQNANCVGEQFSNQDPTTTGPIVRYFAKSPRGLGDDISLATQRDREVRCELVGA